MTKIYESVIVLHPLTYSRGLLPQVLDIITEQGIIITRVRLVPVCATRARLLKFTFNDSGDWLRPLDTVVLVVEGPNILQSVLGENTDPNSCGDSTVKYRLRNTGNRHDTVLYFTPCAMSTAVLKAEFLDSVYR